MRLAASRVMRLTIAVVLLCSAACSEEHGAPDDPQTPEDVCQVTSAMPQTPMDKPRTKIWTYDPVTRRLVTTIYAYDLDEAGRAISIYGLESSGMTRYSTSHYDEHGNIDSYEHYTSGPTAYTNTYDAEGRLKSVESAGAAYAMRAQYRYEEPSAPNVWTLMEADNGADGVIDGRMERTILNGRTDEVRQFPDNGELFHVYKFTYVDDRIDTIERDGGFFRGDGPDGDADIRYHWVRDEGGSVVEFTQDGTDSFDNPVVDGNPDYDEKFSAGCAPLLQQFPWLAHEPAPNSTGPRFRTDAN